MCILSFLAAPQLLLWSVLVAGWVGTGVILDYWGLFLERENFIVKERVGYSEAAQELFGGWG